jgi:hypothetical protein
VRLRNGRTRQDQADPDLFATESISERTGFLADVSGTVAEMAVLRQALLPVLQGLRWLRVGRGGCPVEVVQCDWSEAPRPLDVQDTAYMTLTSDLLVRDQTLCWLTALSPALAPALFGEDLILEVVAQESVVVHGFNGTSRLWRLPAAAIRRGSVFRLRGALASLAAAAAKGQWLGERTHEGFGRYRLDATLPGTEQVAEPGVAVVAAAKPTASQSVTRPAPDSADEAVATATRQWCETYKVAAAVPRSGLPSLSQWTDLVADLGVSLVTGRDPIAVRRTPSTVGANAWATPAAAAVLAHLAGMPDRQARLAHARLFVRWLRTGPRRGAA